MKRRIYVIQKDSNLKQSKLFFKSFNEQFSYLFKIDLLFPDYKKKLYEKYDEDLDVLKRGFSETAELIDTRWLENHKSDPVRLLLTDKFFELDEDQQKQVILHELGHYFTNPRLRKIRNFISIENPKLLPLHSKNPQEQALVDAHNRGLNFIFQIPKLIQEVYAEMWVFENEKTYSMDRIKIYCKDLKESINEFSNVEVGKDFFYRIPELSFLILWRLSIFRYLDFDYIDLCVRNTEKLNFLLQNLSNSIDFGELNIFKLQKELIDSLTYKKEDIFAICKIYESIFKEYISTSTLFFPGSLRKQIIDFYEI